MKKYNAERIRQLRNKLGLSQPQFAKTYGIPIGSLRNWEQGRSVPGGTSATLFFLIEKIPNQIADTLKSRKLKR